MTRGPKTYLYEKNCISIDGLPGVSGQLLR